MISWSSGPFVVRHPFRRAEQDDRGVYVITDARWPRGLRFDQDRDLLFAQMRADFAARMRAPVTPYVTLPQSTA